ncbi:MULTISPECIES: hypothetical protein [Xanthomonas]|uniref:Uncharacterized protein n=2 Tax=Xanthomonas TaxID=338 RepID=A0AB33FEG5_XANCI|nr:MULTISPECIES: hypothetical protein [Xanthomonas]ATS86753.1 hypothetical protein XcfCFBP6991P_22940 [Xanthomonas citri pv. phaseoli var. fuscans]WOP59089.1 hypothetical protein R5577_22810 [Xanthomonas euvesicatoria]
MTRRLLIWGAGIAAFALVLVAGRYSEMSWMESTILGFMISVLAVLVGHFLGDMNSGENGVQR